MAPQIRIIHTAPVSGDELRKNTLLARDLRLFSLKESPDSFVTKYEDELVKPISWWEERMSNPRDHSFAAVLEESYEHDGAIFEAGTWVGMLTVLGPHPLDPAKTTSKMPWIVLMANVFSKYHQTENTDHYHWVGMYVRPEFRRIGVASQLIAESLKSTRQLNPSGRKAVLSIMAAVANPRASALYQKLGFTIRGTFDLNDELQVARDTVGDTTPNESPDPTYALDILVE